MSELDIIKRARKKNLLDRQWLEDAIISMGIYHRNGMIPKHLKEFTGGLNAFQWPCQVAPYLIFLADKGIKSYAEIGISYGGMFKLTVEYLNRFNPIEKALAVDNHLGAEIHEYQKERTMVMLWQGWSYEADTQKMFDIHNPFDLVLIDADHNEDMVRQDYEMVKPYARLIAFHDISEFTTPGVRKVFDEAKGEKVEFIEQYEEILAEGRSGYGLGIVMNDDYRPGRKMF